MKAFSIFFGSVVMVQKAKLLAKKAAVSLLTDGVLWPSASISVSDIGSKDVWKSPERFVSSHTLALTNKSQHFFPETTNKTWTHSLENCIDSVS